ncbi:MAG: radical SAM protein [Candidatus Pacebacteria bacterium CG10_big_fil_rev_8_21_14_0_10_44_11]|nr:MAG: radical SAM protein [Candidatus Pacebacteria bacterium CG10_big_fil_rev_8_21_14_0_10_44_11]
MQPFDIQEIQAKSILSPSSLKDADYDFSCNPYIGCRFGCVYCYASFMGRMVGKKTNDWGEFVFAKMNAPELLKKEVAKLKNKGKGKTIWFSSVTDPYQGLEAKYQLTRKCLQVLVEADFQGSVTFLTKSDLVLRDIDVLKQLHHAEVGMTITSTDDSISRYFEKFAPPVSARLAALKKLHQEKIDTYAFIGPLLPHFITNKEKLGQLFKAVHDVGVREIYVEFLNLSGYIRKRLKAELKDLDPTIWEEFYASQSKSYRNEFADIVYELVKKYGFKLRMEKTLYHKEMK